MNSYADFWPASSGPVLARNFRVAHYWASERQQQLFRATIFRQRKAAQIGGFESC
jgi:hypothetical protein